MSFRSRSRHLIVGAAVIGLLSTADSPRSGAADTPHGTPSGDRTCEGAPGGCDLSDSSVSNSLKSGGCTSTAAVRIAPARFALPMIPHYLPAFRQLVNTVSPQIRVANGPAWARWAVWDKEQTALLLSDIATHSIFHFSLSSGIVRQVYASATDSGVAVNPSVIMKGDAGYIIQDTALGRLLWLDDSYALSHFLQLKNYGSPEWGVIGSVRGWLATRNVIYVLADVIAEGKWSERLLKVEVAAIPEQSIEIKPLRASSVFQWDTEAAVRRHALLTFPIMAAAKGRAFILLDGEASHICEVSNGLRMLPEFPAGYEHFPSFSANLPGKLLLDAYHLIESRPVAVALYGSGDFLYLLLRRPDVGGTGDTFWSVAKVDPDSGSVVDTFPLPSRSANLILVPGRDQWALIEQDAVTGTGMLDLAAQVRGFYLLRSDFFQNPNIERRPTRGSSTSTR